jgi:ASC-1-like (ASCH) protein
MAVKEEIIHLDRLGRKLELDDYVAYSQGNGLHIGCIIKFNPKMVKVKKVKTKETWHSGEYNIYSSQMVKIEGQDALLYVMKTL